MIREIIKIHYRNDVDAHDIDHVILPSVNNIYDDESDLSEDNALIIKRNSLDSNI
eukprot:jgi/Orpsp1_1/1188796/evm.model.d7180000067251.1